MNEAIASFSAKIYTFLLPIAWIGVAIAIVILLPMACFRRTRGAAGTGFYFMSWIFGVTTWFLGAAITFATWGWLALLIGLFLGGVGVVPIGILAAFFSLENLSLGLSLIVMCIIVFITRTGGIFLMAYGSDFASPVPSSGNVMVE